MPNDLKKSIFFEGGRFVYVTTPDESKGLMFNRNDDGSWTIKLEAVIEAAEANDIIRRFIDFGSLNANDEFDAVYPNQVYFEAFTDETDAKPINIPFRSIEMSVLHSHKAENNGQVILRMTPLNGIGKTQNGGGKTQNPAIDIGGAGGNQ